MYGANKKRKISECNDDSIQSNNVEPKNKRDGKQCSPESSTTITDECVRNGDVTGDHLSSTAESGENRGFDIERMRSMYNEPDTEADKEKGITTKFVLHTDPWSIKKKLKNSDIGNLSRLLVGSDSIKNHVLGFFDEDDVRRIEDGEGKRVKVMDLDTQTDHQLVLKRWTTSKSYVFNERWVPDFVKRRNLKEGDQIALHWDSYNLRFNFVVLTRNA